MDIKEIYLVQYYCHREDKNINVFATTDKKVATKYCTKFNKIRIKWQEYYKQFEFEICGVSVLSTKHMNKVDRWSRVMDTGSAFWEKIEIR